MKDPLVPKRGPCTRIFSTYVFALANNEDGTGFSKIMEARIRSQKKRRETFSPGVALPPMDSTCVQFLHILVAAAIRSQLHI